MTRSTSLAGNCARTLRTSLTCASTAVIVVGRAIILICSEQAGSAVSNTFVVELARPEGERLSAGRAKSFRIDPHRQLATEQIDQNLNAVGSIEVSVEDRVQLCQRAALNVNQLSSDKRRPHITKGSFHQPPPDVL